MMFSMLFAFYLSIISNKAASSRSDYTITSKEESYGSWTSSVYCNENQFAYKFEFKHHDGTGDDTSANGVRLHCKGAESSSSYDIETTSAKHWGNWFDTTPTSCPESEFITGFKTKVYNVGLGIGDDTSLNCIQMRCSDGTILKPNDCGSSGSWATTWSECNQGDYVCGFNELYESYQANGDDTALNAVRLECCADTSTVSTTSAPTTAAPTTPAPTTAAPTLSPITTTAPTLSPITTATEITTIKSKEESYGSWTPDIYCRENSIAYKFDFKNDVDSEDKTSGNGIRLYCKELAWRTGYQIETSSAKHYGLWHSTTPSSCPWGTFLIGFKTKVYNVGLGVGDDTSLNCIQMKCSDNTILTPNSCGNDGSWADDWSTCKAGHHICGFTELYETKQGDEDDTGLNAVRFKCCGDPHLDLTYEPTPYPTPYPTANPTSQEALESSHTKGLIISISVITIFILMIGLGIFACYKYGKCCDSKAKNDEVQLPQSIDLSNNGNVVTTSQPVMITSNDGGIETV